MKINPYSSSYTSSSTNTSNSTAASASNREALARRRESAKNAPAYVPQSDTNRDSNEVQRHNFDRQAPPSSKSTSAATPALEDQSAASSRHPISYYSGIENSNQAVDKQGFYVAPADQVSGRESDYADIKRVNNRLNSHALASYREHQAMDEEQAQLLEHQWILGVDTYA